MPFSDLTQPLTGLKIALVDNDLAICEAMQGLIAHWGASITTAMDSATLLDSVDLSTLDMLIVDYHLDDETGIDLAERLTLNRTLPVLVITANYSNELMNQVKAAGYRLLNKPIKPLQLRQILQQLLS